MHAYDASAQHAGFRRWSLRSGAAVGTLWAAFALVISLAAGRSAWWVAILWAVAAGFLAGRLVAILTGRMLCRHWGIASVQVSLQDPATFRRALERRLAWYGYRQRHGGRAGATYTARASWPPLEVQWQGGGAIIEGPACWCAWRPSWPSGECASARSPARGLGTSAPIARPRQSR